jgi:hypothetical protein
MRGETLSTFKNKGKQMANISDFKAQLKNIPISSFSSGTWGI